MDEKGGYKMSGDELQDHINKGMYGTPQLKPDEKRKYLGTFRERVALTLTFAQLKNSAYLAELAKELKEQPELHMIINGKVQNPELSELMKFAQDANVSFTCNTDSTLKHGPDDLAVVVCSKDTALHINDVDVAQKCPLTQTTDTDKETKKHFSLRDLFK